MVDYRTQYPLDNTNLAAFIQTQIPEWYFDDETLWPDFIKLYYNWLAQENNVGYQIDNMFTQRQIDNQQDLNLISELFFEDVDLNNIAGNSRLLIKHIVEVYVQKGSILSFENVFKILFNSNINILTPASLMLQPSTSLWFQPKYIEVFISTPDAAYNALTYLKQYKSTLITGSISKATAVIEDVYVYRINGIVSNVLFISNLKGEFSVGDVLIVNNQETILSVRGSLKYISIIDGGANFSPADTLNIITGSGKGAIAEASTVENDPNTIQFTLVDGGGGYTVNAEVNVTTKATGYDATFKIGSVANTSVLTLNNDYVSNALSTVLNTNYTFFNINPTANLSTTLINALDEQQLVVGSIDSLTQIDTGTNYYTNTNVSVVEPLVASNYIPDGHGSYLGNNAIITGIVGVSANTITALSVIVSGFGYCENEVVELQNSNNNTIVRGIARLGGVGTLPGYWQTYTSEISSTQFLIDDYYYQNFSYDIQTDENFNTYNNFVNINLHPLGFQRFDSYKTVRTLNTNTTITSSYRAA